LAPFTRVPLFICIGKAVKRTWVDEETDEISIKKQVKITATSDHRYCDGKELGKLVKTFVDVCNNVEKYLDLEKEAQPHKH